MPAKSRSSITVSCPHCGHHQQEAPAAYSTVCRKCRQHFRLADLQHASHPKPTPTLTPHSQPTRSIVCFNCSTQLDVPLAASSTMCKRCSCHIDLQDYSISGTVSKNFRTKGNFVIEEKGYLLNSDTIAGEATLKGRFIGKLRADKLTIHHGAILKGSFETDHLVIPRDNQLHWPETITSATTEVIGELVADVNAANSLILRAHSRFFGNVTAQNLIVENGAVLVGQVNIRTPNTRPPPPANPAPVKTASKSTLPRAPSLPSPSAAP